MEFLTDPVLLARIQFALTAMYHYVFVPLSIGLGLIVAIFETKYYRSQSVEDAAASRFWIKVFTATFAQVLQLASPWNSRLAPTGPTTRVS